MNDISTSNFIFGSIIGAAFAVIFLTLLARTLKTRLERKIQNDLSVRCKHGTLKWSKCRPCAEEAFPKDPQPMDPALLKLKQLEEHQRFIAAQKRERTLDHFRKEAARDRANIILKDHPSPGHNFEDEIVGLKPRPSWKPIQNLNDNRIDGMPHRLEKQTMGKHYCYTCREHQDMVEVRRYEGDERTLARRSCMICNTTTVDYRKDN